LKIIIVGGGLVGTGLAQELEKEKKHQITIVEKDLSVCNLISNTLDVLSVNGSGTDPITMQKCEIADADMIVAVTSSDETNIMSCFLASKFGVKTRVARLSSSSFVTAPYDFEELGVTDIIEPENDVLDHILEYIYMPETTQIVNYKSAGIALRGFRVSLTSSIANRTAGELGEITGNSKILHLVVVRNGEAIVPRGDTKILPGDEILSLMPIDALHDFHSISGYRNNGIGKTVISGSSDEALLLAGRLEGICDRLILISDDEQFCRKAAEQLHKTEVLHGPPSSEELLSEIGINSAEFFVPIDDDSEENIMTGLLAKADGAERVIAVTNREKHTDLFKTLGIDHIIQPKNITTQNIFTDIAGISQGTVFRHGNISIDMKQFNVKENSSLAGINMIELRQKVKCDFIVGSIVTGKEVVIPHGKTTIKDGDKITLFFNPKDAKTMAKFFKA
jgi:trk system potassium uptake protein TrkA